MNLMDLIKQKKASLNSGKRQKTVKPGDGRSRWRILPSWRDPKHPQAGQFWHDFGQHFIKDGTGQLKAVYVCTDKTFGKPCPVCSAIELGMRASSDDDMVELLKNSRANGRILLNALQVDGESPNDPQILEVAPSVFNEILNIITEWGDEVLDLDAGKDIIIERVGKGLSTKYSVQIAAKSKPVDASVMSRVANLDEYVQQESEEQARRAIANVSAIAGALPAPTEYTPRAATGIAAAMADLDLDDDSVLDAPKPVTKRDEAAVAATVATATAAATAAVAEAVETGDAELDDLLKELEGL